MLNPMFKSVTTLITHGNNCPDGIASALLVRDALPGVTAAAVNYGDRAHRELVANPGMLFVDMTPPAGREKEFIDAGAICMDHHLGRMDAVLAFGERGFFAHEKTEPGVSGATLAFRHIWLPEMRDYCLSEKEINRVARFAALVGVRDTWCKDSPVWLEACMTSEYLQFLGMDDALRQGLHEVTTGKEWIQQHVWERKMKRARDLAEQASKYQIPRAGGNLMLAVLPALDAVSDAAQMFEHIDIVAGFEYLGPHLLKVSLRSRGEVEVHKIAQYMGGNGHSGAAGFRMQNLRGDQGPYELIVEAVRDWAFAAD